MRIFENLRILGIREEFLFAWILRKFRNFKFLGIYDIRELGNLGILNSWEFKELRT